MCDPRFNLSPMTHDGFVEHQCIHVLWREAGHLVDLEVSERPTVSAALVQDRRPRQAGLCALQHEHFEEVLIVARRHAPFRVVVVCERFARCPIASLCHVPAPAWSCVESPVGLGFASISERSHSATTLFGQLPDRNGPATLCGNSSLTLILDEYRPLS